MFFLLGNSQKSTSALSCQLMQGSAKLFLYFAHARSHSLFVFFCLNARQKFHHHSLELVSMVQLSQCQQKWFILFHVFCLFHFFFVFGRFCVSCGPAFSASKTKTHARTLFKTRASMRRCWHRDSLRSDIWCSFFFCFFPYFSVFVLLFVIFWGNFRSSGQRFFIFFNNKYGRARKKKAQFFFWAQLFLLNRSSGGLDYVMSDDLTSFFFLSYNLLRMLT